VTATEDPLIPTASASANGSAPGGTIAADREAVREEYFGGARLLGADGRMVYLFISEARARVITRRFGITGKNSGIVTLIALGLAADAVHSKVAGVLNTPRAPALGDVIFGGSAMRESVRSIAGTWSQDSPVFATLVLGSLVGTVAHAVLRATVRGSKTSARVARADFDRRYPHIIRRTLPQRTNYKRLH
jgi:hypothetical protein